MWEDLYWTMPDLQAGGGFWTPVAAHAMHFAERWQAEAIAQKIGRVEAGRVVELTPRMKGTDR